MTLGNDLPRLGGSSVGKTGRLGSCGLNPPPLFSLVGGGLQSSVADPSDMYQAITTSVSNVWHRAGAPILIFSLGMAGYCAHIGSRLYLMEQSLCTSYYESHAPSTGTLDSLVLARVDRNRRGYYARGKIPEHMCKVPEIQAELVTLIGMVDALQLVPGLFIGVTWERLSLTLGRKTVLALSCSGSLLGVVYFMAICYFDNIFDLKWVLLMCLWDIIGGGWVSLRTLLYTYITERTESEKLGQYFYNISAWLLGMSGVGMFLASWLMRYEGGAWVTTIVGVALLFCSTLSCYFLPETKTVPPNVSEEPAKIMIVSETASEETLLASDDEEKSYDTFSSSSSSTAIETIDISGKDKLTSPSSSSLSSFLFTSVVKDLGQTMNITYEIFVRDKFSRLCMGTYFCWCLFTSMRGVFPQYASRGFGWTLADADVLWGFEYAIAIVTLVAIPYARVNRSVDENGKEKVTMGGKDKDVFVMLFSMVVSAAGLLMLGFAQEKTTYVVSLVVFTVGYSGLPDSLRNFAQKEMKESSTLGPEISLSSSSSSSAVQRDRNVGYGYARKGLEDENDNDDVSFLALDGGNLEENFNNPALSETTPLIHQKTESQNTEQEVSSASKTPTDQISRFFVGFSLVENFAYFVGCQLWSGLYALTLREGWRPVWIFIGCSFCCTMGFLMVISTEKFRAQRSKGKSRDRLV